MPKLCLISDTHNQLDMVDLPPADILIHAGDATGNGTVREIAAFNQQLGEIKNRYRHIVFIAGNHDFLFERDPALARSMMTNCIYLMDSEVTIEGLRIYGSPWQPRFFDWAFNLNRGPQLAAKWALIPAGLDVLVTHGPPMGILDITMTGEHVGCEELMKRIENIKPRWHVFGHIHHSHGMARDEHTTYINASTCDERYRPVNPPILIEVP
ncbi:MAG TPA: metallophosphatase domain-containing protein [Blastocatellia bacterium]|nr:metallophosphatase domain-containing protein [Blastocatellia bacterium]